MKKVSLFVSLLLSLFVGAVSAHGPVRAKMTATVMIDASAHDIWNVIKNFDDLSWLPLVKSVSADKGNQKGSVRVITLNNGGTITEQLKAYKGDKRSYKYKIIEMSSTGTVHHAGKDEDIPVLPVENYAATLSVEDEGETSKVTWVATYYRAYVNNNPPEELNEKAADKAVSSVLTEGLVGLAKQFDGNARDADIKIKIKR